MGWTCGVQTWGTSGLASGLPGFRKQIEITGELLKASVILEMETDASVDKHREKRHQCRHGTD